ncbi:MAG: twin-arginine translocation pathway signal, partial [Pseudomonadota bacterium]
MTALTRRGALLGGTAGLLAACGGGVNSGGRDRIDQRVTSAVGTMQSEFPFTSALMERAAGMLV